MQFKQWLEADTIDVVQNYLQQIEQAGFVLVAHQTLEQIAAQIIRQDFGRPPNILDGTSNVTNSQQIREMINAMQQRASGGSYAGILHKESNSVVIMALPKKLPVRMWTTRSIDEYLWSLADQKKLTTPPKLPNQYILGYWKMDGNMYQNSKFNPQGIL